MDARWDSKWEDIVRRYGNGEVGLSNLTATEMVWLCTLDLIESTRNGGLISYFYNPSANHYAECVRALDVLGASDVRAQVERMAALFGASVPVDIDQRNDIINSWSDREGAECDALCEEIDEALYPMFDRLESKLHEFLERSELAIVVGEAANDADA